MSNKKFIINLNLIWNVNLNLIYPNKSWTDYKSIQSVKLTKDIHLDWTYAKNINVSKIMKL